MTFEPTSKNHNLLPENLYLLHGTLPREVVCTENLTPFLKLLPCKGKAGIASLLDGHKIFDASWQSMAIDVRSVCPEDKSQCSIEMEQTVDMVLDVERSKRPRGQFMVFSCWMQGLTDIDNPIPRPIPREGLLCDHSKSYASDETCYPSDTSRGQSWTLAEIFGRRIQGSCLAEDSEGSPQDSLYLEVPNEREVYINQGVETKHDSGVSRSFELPKTDDFEIVLSHLGPQTFNNVSQPPLYASRSFTGHGQERGGVQTLLTNPSITSAIEFVYFETLPWFMKPYLHTLTARLSTTSVPDPRIIKETVYRPALDRRRGTQLELLISVPADSTVILTYDFDKAILRYTEYPPDANRGFDVAPAVIRLLGQDPGSSSISQQPVYIRTSSLLLPLPTPDFSMPYNVIILTSTVMALAFGMIYNLLVRRFVGADEVESYDFGAIRTRVINRVRLLKDRVTQKRSEKKMQ